MAFSNNSNVRISVVSSQEASASNRYSTPFSESVRVLGSKRRTWLHAVPRQSIAKRGAKLGRSFSGNTPCRKRAFWVNSRISSTVGSKLGNWFHRLVDLSSCELDASDILSTGLSCFWTLFKSGFSCLGLVARALRLRYQCERSWGPLDTGSPQPKVNTLASRFVNQPR